jgi:hypothetical protein
LTTANGKCMRSHVRHRYRPRCRTCIRTIYDAGRPLRRENGDGRLAEVGRVTAGSTV